ncbi:MAG TPA: hypothetical protein VD927_18980 [Chryseosolibacter sp.]|nr:hypothetical protein [Chryseosolibacter sp.]
MKLSTICFAILMYSGAALAQDDDTTTTIRLSTISKGVQQLQFKNTSHKPSRIFTGNAIGQNKSVSNTHARNYQPLRRVGMTGASGHVAAKGIARMQIKRNKETR